MYQQFILFDIEQSRVLVYESDRIMEQLMRAGGIADFIALFIQQFFLYNVAGAAIMAVLLVLTSVCLNKFYEYAAGRSTSLAEKAICCIPAGLLFVYTECEIFFTTGHVAILLAALSLLLGAYLVNKKNIATYIILPPLVIFTGFAVQTAVWPMIASLILYSLIYKKNYIAAGEVALSAVLMVGLARFTMLAVTNDELFSPDIFSFRLRTETDMPLIWASFILLTILPLVFNKFVPEKVHNNVIFAIVMAAAVFGITRHYYNEFHDEATFERITLQRWVDTGENQKAMDFCFGHLNNTYTSNIYFMLRSQESELENEVGGLLKEGQQLIMPKSSIRLVRRHLMSLYYYLGYINGAQREAFEYNEPTEGMMVPAAVKILAKTNIIMGNYAAGEKYLNYLDHTLFYSDWANQYRKFLYNDKAVENDSELGPRRKAMYIESVPQMWTTLAHIVRQIAYSAPELPATNYKKAFIRLGDYDTNKNYDNHQQSYIQY